MALDADFRSHEALDARWSPLIQGAWLGRQNHDSEPLAEDLIETWAFIRYAIERSKR